MKNDIERKLMNLIKDFKDYLEAANLRLEDDAEFNARFEALTYDIVNRYNYLHPHS